MPEKSCLSQAWSRLKALRYATSRQKKKISKRKQLSSHAWETGIKDTGKHKKPDFTDPKCRFSDGFIHLLLYRIGSIVYLYELSGVFLSKESALVPARSTEPNPACAAAPLSRSLHQQHCAASQSTGLLKTKTNINKTTQTSKKPKAQQQQKKLTYSLSLHLQTQRGHCCIPDVPLHLHFEVCMFQHAGFLPFRKAQLQPATWSICPFTCTAEEEALN